MHRYWNQYPVVLGLSQHGPLFDADTDDFELAIVYGDGLSEWIHQRKQIFDDIGSNDTDIPGVIDIVFIEQPSTIQGRSENRCRFRRVTRYLRVDVFAP